MSTASSEPNGELKAARNSSRRPATPTLTLHQRQLLNRLDTLEALTSFLVSRDEQRRDLLWDTADILAAWIAAHNRGGPITPVYRAIAHATGSSTGFIRDLVRTAGTFPPDVRAQYADKGWQFFAECLRDGDPQAAAARYAEMSVREIRDYRRTQKNQPEAPGYTRLSLTLRPDHMETLTRAGLVTVSTVLPDGCQGRVTIVHGPRALVDPAISHTHPAEEDF